MCHYNCFSFNIIINSSFCISIHLLVILFFILLEGIFIFLSLYSNFLLATAELYLKIMLFHFFLSINFQVTMAHSRQKLSDFKGFIILRATIYSTLISMAATFSFPFYRTYAHLAHLSFSFYFRPLSYVLLDQWSLFWILQTLILYLRGK